MPGLQVSTCSIVADPVIVGAAKLTGAVLPPDAVGRDYLPEGKLFQIDADGRDMHATLYGLAGI